MGVTDGLEKMLDDEEEYDNLCAPEGDVIEINIVEEWLQLCGAGTLLGYLITRARSFSWERTNNIILNFPQTTMCEKHQNGGPKKISLFEHSIPCLIESIFDLQNNGIKVTIKMREGE